MIKDEYQRLMKILNTSSVSGGVCKIANLVLENLDTIQSLTPHQGKRIKKIVQLAQEHWTTLSSDISTDFDEVDENTETITRLKTLQVGPFRGFYRQEHFDLDSSLV